MDYDPNDATIKIISPTVHGVLDYLFVALLLIAPSVIGLTGVFAFGSYGLAVAHLVLTVTTKFPPGLFSVLPLRVHGLIELLVAIGLVVSPWIFNFADMAVERNFFLGFGVLIFAGWVATRYQTSPPAPTQSDVDKSVDKQPDKDSDVSDTDDEIMTQTNNE